MSTVLQSVTVTTGRIGKTANTKHLRVRSYARKPDAFPEYSDYALARAAAHGGTSALAVLYERHNRQVYSICLRMTHDSSEAEDLTQEVFMHLVCKLGSFRGESQFTTWLHRLTVNIVLMYFRRRRTRREHEFEDAERKKLTRPRQSAGAQITDRIALNSALARLPSGCRRVFVLFDVEGYRHEEIAHLLGCSAGTSKSQLHKARIKLRRLFANEASN